MKKKTWIAYLCCAALLFCPISTGKRTQGAEKNLQAAKNNEIGKKDHHRKETVKKITTTNSSEKEQTVIKNQTETSENLLSDIPSKKEQELIKNTELNKEDIPEEILENADVTLDEIKDIDETDNLDLNSFTTVNQDNSKTLHIFQSPVKYYDEKQNQIKFIDNTLKSSRKTTSGEKKYAYENKSNNIKTYLPENSREYVSITDTNEKAPLSFTPVGEKQAEVKKKIFTFLGEQENIAEYAGVFGKGYDLQYIPQGEGVKENIYIRKNRGKYTFSFHVKAPGLQPDREEGQEISFLDKKTGETIYTLGKLYLRDSYTGKPDNADHLSFENKYRIQQVDGDCYLLTYVLDKKFLTSTSTRYPVLVDPSITTSRDSFYDAPVYSKKSTQNFGGNAFAEIGKVSSNYGVGYGYFQTNDMDRYIYINPKKITKATLRVYEGSGTTYASKILAYDTDDTWLSSTITWKNKPGKSGSALSSQIIKKSGFYEFAITSCAKNWLADKLGEDGYTQRYGILLAPESSSQGRKDICTINYGTTSKKPCIKIQYTEDTSVADGTYFLENSNSGKNLTIDGKIVEQRTATSGMKQQWTIKGLANGYYCIANRYHGGKGYLRTYQGDGPKDATIWVDGTGDPIRYKIVKNNDGTGTYRILSKVSGDLKALSIDGGSKANGVNAAFSGYTTHAKKKWKLKKVPASQLQPDIYIKNVTNYVVSTVTSNPITATIYSPYTHTPATQTLFQLYDSSGTLVHSQSISTSALKGEEPKTVTLNWKPQKTGKYTLKITADAGKVVSESNEGNNTYTKTIDVIKGYIVQVKNYYDEGFVVRYGSNGVANLKAVTKAAQVFYRDAFGLWLVTPEPEKITSQMDQCKKDNQGGVNKTTIDKQCTHPKGIHTNWDYLWKDLWYNHQNDAASNKMIIQWTGHTTGTSFENKDPYKNRSYAIQGNHLIMMLDIPTEKEFSDRITYIYEHELAHTLSAPDHYCYADNDSGKCTNENCVKCHQTALFKQCENCIMMQQMNNFLLYSRNNVNKVFCVECKKNVNQYLKDWCIPENYYTY